MAKSTYSNLISTYDTFANWLTKTNDVLNDMKNSVVTTNTSATADVTTGNGFVNGFFGANTLYAAANLYGGTPSAVSNLNISSNVFITSNATVNALFTTINANVTSNLNAVIIVANNITSNQNLTVSNTTTLNVANITTATVSTANITSFANIVTANVTTLNVNTAVANVANVTTANISTLGVTGLSTLVNVSIGTGTSNVLANTTVLTIQNPSATATINATSFSGTAANATLLNSQNGAFYTNATNITTGTLPWAQAPTNTVNTTGAFTITGVHTMNANLFVNAATLSVGNSTVNVTTNTTVLVVGNTTANATVSTTGLFVVNASSNVTINPLNVIVNAGSTTGQVSANATAVSIGNATVNSTVTATGISYNGTLVSNSTIYSGTANNANNLGGVSLSTLQTQITSNSSNVTTFLTTNAYNITGVVTYNANLFINTANQLLVGNTTVNAAVNQTTLSVANSGANTSINPGLITFNGGATINNTIYTGTANNANALGGYIANTTSPSDGFVLAYNQSENRIKWVNPSGIQTTLSTNNVVANSQLQAGSNGTTFVATITGNSTSTNAVFRANNISFAVDSGAILYNSNLFVNTSVLSVGNTTANVTVNTTSIVVGNGTVNVSINSTAFSGTANNATNLGGSSLATLQGQITGNAATAYTNAIAIAANASNITTGTLGAGFLPSTVVNTSGAFTITGVHTMNANLFVNAATLSVGNSTVNVAANTTVLSVGNTTANVTANTTTIVVGTTTVNVTINSTSFSGTANNATNFNGVTLATLQGQITGNAATAYTNAIAISANASNINTGTIGAGFLPATVVNTSASFTLAGDMIYNGTARFNANVGFNVAPGTSSSRFNVSFPTTTHSTDVLLVQKTRDSANAARYGFTDVGGLTTDTSGAFWRGFHLQAPSITDGATPTPVTQFPRFVIAAETETLTNPSTRRWLLEAGNDSATSRYSIVMRTAAVDRLIIDGSGNVGIGGSPSRALDVQGQQIRVLAGADGSGYEGFSGGTHLFSLTRVNNNVRLSSYDGIQFWTNATAGVSGGAERMRIDSGGNVAIGWTTTSTGTLSVNGPDTGTTAGNIGLLGRFRFPTGNAGGIDFVGVRNSAGSDWTTAGVRLQSFVDATFQSYIQFNGNGLQHGISFGTGSSTTDRNVISERMRITQTGQVGIGSAGATPARTTISSSGITNLNAPVLASGGAANASLFVTGADTSYGLVFGTNNSDGRVWLQSQRVDSTTSYPITLNEGGGNVGIGLTTPSQALDVQNNIRARGAGDGFAFIARAAGAVGWNAIQTSASTASGYFATYNSSSTRIGFNGWWDLGSYYGAWTDGATPIIFGTQGSTRYTIQSDGVNYFTTTVNMPSGLFIRRQGGVEGGEFLIEHPASSTTMSGTALTVDTNGNNLRIFENGGSFRGIGIDITTCESQSTFATTTTSQTFTTKRINPRISSAASGDISPDISAADQYNRTALAAAATINAPTGTPVNGNKLMFRLRDNGTARALTWNGTYRAVGVTLPTTTTASKTTYVGCVFNSDENFWDVIAVSTQA